MRLILLCDQFEEIFDESITPEERTLFVEAIRGAVTTGRVWVVATLRADYFGRCSELPERFRDLFIGGDGIFTVGGPRPAEIAQMIRRPAAIAGLQFERRQGADEGLDDVVLNEAVGNPTVLPLLEFALAELWRRSLTAGTRILSFADYEELGGLHGALKLRANEVFNALDARVQSSLPEVLSALVRTDLTDEKHILQNRVPFSHFANLRNSRELVDAFVAAHLFVGDKALDATPVIGLAHEALLREWPPAVDWIKANRELLELRSSIISATAFWRASGFGQRRLLTGPLLKDAAKLLRTNPTVLPSEETRFIELSVAEDRRRRKHWTAAGTVMASLVAIAIAVSVIGRANLAYGLSFARALPTVWEADSHVPISQGAQATLDSNIKSLVAFLTPKAAERSTHLELTAWTLAEMWAALRGIRPDMINGPSLREAVNATRDQNCFCWRETDDKPPHAMATAWVEYALALYDQPATQQEIRWTLKQQAPAGWWPMFPSTSDNRNGSVAATAFMVLALHEQRAHKLISSQQSSDVDAAIDRGAAWLTGQADASHARWMAYPREQTFEREKPYLAISALVMHVLRTVKGADGFDLPWLNNLPLTIPKPSDGEEAKG